MDNFKEGAEALFSISILLSILILIGAVIAT